MPMKTFLLCVGAQKSGTTWLHDYLLGHPNADMGFMKEYHVLDALFLREAGMRRMYLQERIDRVVGYVEGLSAPGGLFGLRKAPAMTPAVREDLRLLKFLGNPEHYFAYFQALVERSPQVWLTGDVTPSYSALPVEALELVRDGFARRGIAVKVVFLMRDPVERCVSAAAHAARKKKASFTGRSYGGQDDLSIVLETYATEAFEMRTRYDLTIANLERVFAPEDLHYVFYEQLFQEATMREMVAFLSIPFREPDYQRRVNGASRPFEAPGPAVKQQIYLHYAQVYEFIAQRFGEQFLRETWKNHRAFSPAANPRRGVGSEADAADLQPARAGAAAGG